MDPPIGEAYLRMIGLTADGDVCGGAPFSDLWSYDESNLARSERWQHLRLSGNEKKRVHAVAADDRLGVTVALDKAVNGTSLVLAFEFSDAVLLFPADAQWGTWDEILSDPAHRDLVARTTFLKVGHHGSHNATPRDFVELLEQQVSGNGNGRAAMVSTHKMARWPRIPKAELLDALGKVTSRVARSDHGGDLPVAGFDNWSEDFIDLQIPLTIPDGG
jgi:beta-lactamase superfamily II metal-dependent hydrolase